jgi:CHAD domain-containing protein
MTRPPRSSHDPGDRDQGQPAELTASERDELHRLRQEADELRGEVEIQREILRKTAVWLAQEMEEGRGDQ